jgi:hypothetical protein
MVDEEELMKGKFFKGIKMTTDQEQSMKKSLYLMQIGKNYDPNKKCAICGKFLYTIQCPHTARDQEALDQL